jgi:hypothetical protein
MRWLGNLDQGLKDAVTGLVLSLAAVAAVIAIGLQL